MSRKIMAVIILTVLCTVTFSSVRAAPSVSAQSAILIEKNSGRVLFEKNADTPLPMASTTKIITAMCALNVFGEDLDKTVEISEAAAGVEGSSMYLEPGERMTIRELLYGLMLQSGNDAAVAIAEAVSGDVQSFVRLMNETAQKCGADNTQLTNPNGLPDDGHFSTARDMANLTAHAFENPQFAEIVKTKTFKITGEGKAYPRTLSNHNKLLNMYDGCIGVKTGFTKAAGRCLVSAAERNGMTLICVTLNAPSDWSDHRAILDFGFDGFSYTKIIDSNLPVTSAEIVGSEYGIIPVYPEKDVYYPLADGENAATELTLYPELSAPLSEGESVGEIRCCINGKEISSGLVSAKAVPLIIKSDVKKRSALAGFIPQFIESLREFYSVWLNMI